jgi:hypothetical protein
LLPVAEAIVAVKVPITVRPLLSIFVEKMPSV